MGIQILMITAPDAFIYVAIEVIIGTIRGAGASFIPGNITSNLHIANCFIGYCCSAVE